MKNLDKRKYFYLFLILLVVAYCVKQAIGNGDFKVFLEAAKLVNIGENPYHNYLFVDGDQYLLYYYSPLWTLILIPFTYMNNFVPNMLWLLANLYFLYRIWVLLKGYINLNSIPKKQWNWILFLTIVMSIRFVLYNLNMIQMTFFLLWGCLESIQLFKNKKNIGGGILLALIINIKILPLVILPYLVYRKHYIGALSTVVFSLFFLLLPAIFLGWNQNTFLLTEWWSVINPTNSEHLIESDIGPHSLTALIPTLLTDTDGDIEMSRNILNLNKDSAIMALNVTRIFLVGLSLYFLKWPPFAKATSKLFQLRELAYLILLIPLIFPHQQKYAFALSIPALFYLLYFLFSTYSNKACSSKRWKLIIVLMIFSFILCTLSTDGLIGRELNLITQHIKLVTWGTLVLIVSLVLAKPGLIKKL